jgi:hypothetical protein
MLTTILIFIIGAFAFSLIFKLIFSGLRLILKLLGLTLALPFLIIVGIILLPIIVLALGTGLAFKLLPFIIGGGLIYLVYKSFFADKYWYK